VPARKGQVLQIPTRLPGTNIILQRFGPLLGRRRTRESMELLRQVHSAHNALRRAASAIRGRGINIFTQWVGDPDALGSAVVLRAILTELGASEVRILTGRLGHPQNRNLVDRCGIRLRHPNKERLARGLSCMVDTSPPVGMAATLGMDPVRDYFFVADHHADPADVEENCRARGVRIVKLAYVGLPVGSTSAFMAVLGYSFDVLESLGPAGRAAAALGIYTDTSALLHGATPLDFKMFEVLTKDEAAQDILDELRDYRVPGEWYVYKAAAFQNMEVTGAVRVAPIGFVREEHRDVIAEIANELLRIEGTSIGVAVAVTERGTEVSLRADSRLLGEQPSRIVRVIDRLLETACPGVSGFKYQRRPPHRVEGGACLPLTEREERELRPSFGKPNGGGDIVLAHCRFVARMLVGSIQALKDASPADVIGLL